MQFDVLEGLDGRQKDAAACLDNSVVAAGAGSGKTRVLAARYAWLVLEKGFTVDRIVTLTFTQKAVTEMYGRIYAELCRAAPYSEAARKAVSNFHTARISTLDSYCASIARAASRYFGLSPDFTVDNAAVRDQIRQEALSFIVRNRENSAIRLLLGEKSLEQLVDGLFVKTFIHYSTLTSPIDFDDVYDSQRNAVCRAWERFAGSIARSVETARAEFDGISDAAAQKTVVYGALKTCFSGGHIPDFPLGSELDPLFVSSGDGDPAGEKDKTRQRIALFLDAAWRFSRVSFTGRITNPALALIKSLQAEVRESYRLVSAAANYLLYADSLRPLFKLLDEFQLTVNRFKRLGGTLTFLDVSRLALDALIRLPHIRRNEKASIGAIMIDEFQDNNEAQRDLLFLLAEKENRCGEGVPSAEELCGEKLFFVGDEKQSIYKFRGADVSVFRKLRDDLDTYGRIRELDTNYRSHPALIEAFNEFFTGVFERNEPQPFDASYANTSYAPTLAGERDNGPRVHLYLYDAGAKTVSAESSSGENAASDSAYNATEAAGEGAAEMEISDTDEIEASFTAKKIEELVAASYAVFKNDRGTASWRPCAYEDFAILFRSYGKQHLFEKHLRSRRIPYTCENIAGFFNDAPVNDLYNLLRLVAYPQDTNAYGSVLCSPFARLSRLSMLACLAGGGDLFNAQNEACLEAAEAAGYARCRGLYRKLCELQNSGGITELVSFLWYDAGYRFETLWNAPVQLYAQLYDYFFELARQADAEGLPLIAFVDRLESLKASGERIEDTDIPVEQSGGVRLMSIHKSKGLEFPIVFICGVENQGRNLQNSDLCFYDALYGFSVNLPPHPLVPFEKNKVPGNYFFNIQKGLEEQKNAAELRRLFYVACTRAESALFITGSFKLGKKDEPESDSLADKLACLAAKENRERSFLDLLLPALQNARSQYTLEPIAETPFSGGETPLLQAEAARAAEIHYDRAQSPAIFPPQQKNIPASGLGEPEQKNSAEQYTFSFDEQERDLFDFSGVDRVVQESQNAFTYADFGTMAHSCLESLFSGEAPRYPSRLLSVLSEADYAELSALSLSLSRAFADSPCGRLARNASWLKTEFAFKTRVDAPFLRSGYLLISGKIDLIFENAGELTVVDFKTDSVEDGRHAAQLAAYARAASDIFGKKTRCMLYYLRTGTVADLSAKVSELSVEECAADYYNNFYAAE